MALNMSCHIKIKIKMFYKRKVFFLKQTKNESRFFLMKKVLIILHQLIQIFNS